MIHGEDKVEIDEVRALYLPGPLVFDIDAVIAGDCDRAPVGRIAGMPGTGPGGIDANVIVKAALTGKDGKNAFGQWRPADIAFADKQDRDGFHDRQSFKEC